MSQSTYHPTFAKISSLLDLRYEPQGYVEFMAQFLYDIYDCKDDIRVLDYWQRLADYVIARCPICGTAYTEKLDLHSIFQWGGIEGSPIAVFDSKRTRNCDHFVCVNYFINLNGHYPTEVDRFMPFWSFHNTDKPFLTLELLLRGGTKTGAVMHSLPICKIVEGRFVPIYSLYMISYFAEKPKEVYRQANDELYPPELQDPEEGYHGQSVFTLFSHKYTREQRNDFKYWAKNGKLGWLDLDDPELALKWNDPATFPYQNITGFGYPYTYYRKLERPLTFEQKLTRLIFRWPPDGEIRRK